jgi:RNA polymerase sigma-70 factor (ECF subfamily)
VARMALEQIDKDVISRAVHKDPGAFTELYSRYATRVYRHIYYLVGNRQEAEDLTAEAFLNAWKAVERYEDRGVPIESWFLRIGHNLAIKYLKRHRIHVPAEDTLEADPRLSPEVLQERAAEQVAVRTAILKLPDVQRQVVIWRCLEGMDYGDVAAMLGRSEGNIRVIQHRALKRLRKLLEPVLFKRLEAAPAPRPPFTRAEAEAKRRLATLG